MAASPVADADLLEVSVIWQITGEPVITLQLLPDSTIAAVKALVRTATGLLEDQQQFILGEAVLCGSDSELQQVFSQQSAGPFMLGLVAQDLQPWTLRFPSLPRSLKPGDLEADLSVYGNILHVHHLSEGNESIVLFARKEAADRAAAALSETGINAIPAVKDAMAGWEELLQRHFTMINKPSSTAPLPQMPVPIDMWWPSIMNLFACGSGVVQSDEALAAIIDEVRLTKFRD